MFEILLPFFMIIAFFLSLIIITIASALMFKQ